jgi:hypothetical protein
MSITSKPKLRNLVVAAAAAALAGGAGVFWFYGDCDICQAATTIPLSGTVAMNCTINVTSTSGASNLNLTGGVTRIQVGDVIQSCNDKAGYTLAVTSANCSSPTPTGAKVYDSVSGDFVSYSGEFANPTTGGSQASVIGLLATACSNQIGRNVTGAKISGEDSSVWINYTGNPNLSAATYTDTLTVVLTTK